MKPAIWNPYNMSRCDCETKQHEWFCIYYHSNQRELFPEIGTEIRPVKETKRGI